MGRYRMALALVVLALGLTRPAAAAPSVDEQGVGDCRFVLGFAVLHARLPGRIGNCLADERHNPGIGGDVQLQPTVGGLLIWSKQGNRTAFTDGASTWIVEAGGPRRFPNPPQLRFVWIAPPPMANCRFTGGFAVFASLVPGIIGQCVDDERDNPINTANPNAPFQRDGVQHTTRGLLAYRFADHHTAFTDGYRTIVHGPCGMEERLNSQRFPWEANAKHLPVVADAYLAALAQVPAPSLPPACRS